MSRSLSRRLLIHRTHSRLLLIFSCARVNFQAMDAVRDIASEVWSLEPAVRQHEPGAATRLGVLFEELKGHVDHKLAYYTMEPEFEVALADLRTKMHMLIQAAAAQHVFKGASKRRSSARLLAHHADSSGSRSTDIAPAALPCLLLRASD
jgi:hypothetical protein